MSDYPQPSTLHLPAIVTVLVYMLNARSGIAVGTARKQYNVPVPVVKGPPEFERVFRAHANNAEQYPQFLALMWTAAVFVDGRFAGGLGIVWVVLRNLYVSQYHKSNEGITSYTIPAYLILSTYSIAISVVVLPSMFKSMF